MVTSTWPCVEPIFLIRMSKEGEKAQVSAELQQFIAQEQAKAQVRACVAAGGGDTCIASRAEPRQASGRSGWCGVRRVSAVGIAAS